MTTARREETMLARFAARAAAHPDRVALRPLDPGTSDATLTWRAWHEASRAVAAALVLAGVQPGDRVAVLAGNRTLWPVADLGILMAGAVGVGLYPTSAPVQVAQVLGDAGAVAIIVDHATQLAKVATARAALPALRLVVGEEAADTSDAAADGARVASWRAWVQAGARVLATDAAVAAEVARRTAAARPRDDAVLVYTSGSTGEPKGARLTHRYLAASADALVETLQLGERDTTLSFLPYCHAGERVFGLYTRIAAGMETGLVEDHTGVWAAARAYHPTVFGGLPRFWEKLHEGLVAARAAASEGEAAHWDDALALGAERNRRRRAGEPVPVTLEATWQAASAPVRAVVRAWTGDRLRVATSGGATLQPAVAESLDALGVTVLGAYGMTEHLCAAFHRADRYDFTSVGPPMPGTEPRIAEDGELLLRRGALTFAGYHRRDAETADAFTPDGEWLRTGDLATIGADGTLRITGRKKELIALSTGKKVAPLPIEAQLAADPWIAQAVLHGEGRKFLAALVCPRRSTVEAWGRDHAAGQPYAALLRDPDVRARIAAAIEQVNAGLSRTEQVRRFALLDRELSVEADELTPTLKVRRARIAELYRDRLDAMYQEQHA